VEGESISCREVAGVSSEGLICAAGGCEEQAALDSLSWRTASEGHPYRRQPKKAA